MWHFRRACSLTTRALVWVNADNTYIGTAVTIAKHGRAAHSN